MGFEIRKVTGDFEENTFLRDAIDKIAKEQMKAFDDKAMKALNTESVMSLFSLCIDELKERGVKQVRNIQIK